MLYLCDVLQFVIDGFDDSPLPTKLGASMAYFFVIRSKNLQNSSATQKISVTLSSVFRLRLSKAKFRLRLNEVKNIAIIVCTTLCLSTIKAQQLFR